MRDQSASQVTFYLGPSLFPYRLTVHIHSIAYRHQVSTLKHQPNLVSSLSAFAIYTPVPSPPIPSCAVVAFTHNITRMVENNSYVRCLPIDFSKAFDVVRHCILLSKLSKLDIPPVIHNWIIAFLTGRSQVCKTSDGRVSDYFCFVTYHQEHNSRIRSWTYPLAGYGQ